MIKHRTWSTGYVEWYVVWYDMLYDIPCGISYIISLLSFSWTNTTQLRHVKDMVILRTIEQSVLTTVWDIMCFQVVNLTNKCPNEYAFKWATSVSSNFPKWSLSRLGGAWDCRSLQSVAKHSLQNFGNFLRAAPCKYRLWPCKIEKSGVLKLFLGIALGPPITEIAILIGSGNFFFLIWLCCFGTSRLVKSTGNQAFCRASFERTLRLIEIQTTSFTCLDTDPYFPFFW